MNSYSVDFETTYAKGRDIRSLGVVPYLEHRETDIYLVAIKGPDVDYCGPLEEAPWDAINGHHWVSHNAAFDAAAFREAKRRGKIPASIDPIEWDCTADLCAYLAAGRSLKDAAKSLFGEELSKGVRDEMKGRIWATMTPEFRAQCIEYARNDATMCHRIWTEQSARWPEQERELSRHTRMMTQRGIGIDRLRVEEGIRSLATALWQSERCIPWAGTVDEKDKPIPLLSIKALRHECTKLGIPPPLSTADKTEHFENWMEKYAARAPFVRAVKDYRSIYRTGKLLKRLRDQVRSDGRLRYSLIYFGTHTGRFSGGGGLNIQNLTKRDVEGVNIRACLVPGPGKKFIVADLSQIEARVALWFAGDTKQLDLVRSGLDLYEAHARSQMGYNRSESLRDYCEGKDCPHANLRQFAKCRVLGLGFGLGWKRYIEIVAQWTGITITGAQALSTVTDFRNRNPGITKIWQRLDSAMKLHLFHREKGPFTIQIPSGRVLEYFDVNGSADLRARVEMGGILHYWYGGKLFQNLVQATSRDLFAELILRVEAAGHSVVLHGHDEIVAEVGLDVPDAAIRALMTATPAWAPGLPIGCTVKSVDRYFK